MSEVYAARRARLRERCNAGGSAAALISRPANVRYLAGAAPQGAVLLLGRTEDMLLVSAGPPDDRPTQERPDEALRVHALPESPVATRPSRPPTSPPARAPTPSPWRSTTSPWPGTAPSARSPPGCASTDLGGAVEQLRVVKDEEEISCLRIGAEIADQALGELLESILVGRTERHLALELERRLVDHGADGPAFPTSVGTGPNSGRRGHRPTDRRVEEGDFLSVCLGATYRGYRCEIGRTFVIGTSPADWQIELYDLVFAAQRAGRESPGTRRRLPGRGPRGPSGAGLRGVHGGPHGR